MSNVVNIVVIEYFPSRLEILTRLKGTESEVDNRIKGIIDKNKSQYDYTMKHEVNEIHIRWFEKEEA